MRHSTRFYYFSYLLICLLFATQNSYADGSKDLYPSGKTGRRAYLRAYTNPNANWPFANDGTHYVYAKVGEVITLASSAQNTGGNARIRLFSPSGTQEINNTTGGQISNRTAELAGPRLVGQAAGGNRYLPIYHTVTVEGIYRVEFVARGTSDPGTSYNADANWTEADDAGIRAWDVSVINTANDAFISGRIYTNVLNLTNGLTSPNSTGFEGILHVLTKDGYTYRVNNNGNNGLYFTFLVNNNGFLNQTTQEPIYKSLNTTTSLSGQVHDPNSPDNSKQITHKIFYTLPANDLPTTASGAVPGGNTWLKNTIVLPEVTNINFVGVDGTIGQVSNRGGYIRFTAGTQGNVTIIIESTESPASFAPRTITGFATSGVNDVLWDGNDGTGAPMPAGNVPAKVKISLQGAEVHFPFFDMEYNRLGTIIELLDHNNLNNAVSDLVYWNDTGISAPTSGSSPNPINNSQLAPSNSTGVSSNSNGHKWGVGGSGTGGLFGDNRSIDTWTFIKGPIAEITSTVVVKIADLKISEITPDKTAIVPGDNVTYTVKVKNDGPSDVEGAPFTFVIPTGFNPQSFTFSGNGCGTEALALSYDAATRTYSSRLDLPNGCEITYNVTVSVTNTAVAGNQQFTATILRPNDVTDPDATSNITPTVPPTDPYVECANNGLGVACNNILNNTNVVFTNIPPSPEIRLTKTGTYADSNSDGKVNVGDQINYTFKVENTGNVSISGISISDPKVTVTGGPISLAPNAVDNTSFTAVYTLTQADIDKGGVYNLATANGTDPSNNPVNDESESGNPAGGTPGVPPVDPACPGCTITPLPSSPAMRLTKTGTYADSNSDGKVNAGDQINYTFKVENTGNVSLTNIGISDPKVTVTGGPISLAPNAVDNTSFTAVYTLTQADIDKGGVYNLATANGTDPSNNPVNDESESGNPAGGTPGVPPVDPACPNCTITPLPSSPAMRLTKTGTYADSNSDGKVNVGDQINYTFKVENTGNVSISGISISDPKVTVTGGPISLAPNAVDNTSFTAVYTLTQADIDKGGVYNLATANGTDPSNNPVNDESESGNPAGGTPGVPPVDPACPNCTITPLPSSPAMRLTKTGTYADNNSDGKVNVGDQINYTFKVENTGNVSLTNIGISDPKVTVTGGPISLAPNAVDNTSFTAVYTLTQADIDKGGVYNLATANGTDPSNNPVNDESESGNPAGGTPGVPPVDPACPNCTITPLPSSPAMRLTKTGTYADSNSDGKVNVGDQINYTFKVENTGNVSISGISISDPKVTVTGGPISLAPNAVDNTSFTAVYTLTQADIDKGGVYNLATANGTDPSNNPVNDESESGNPAGGTPGVPPVDPACPNCTITPLPSSPAMRLIKTGTYADSNSDGKVNVGDQINYTFKVENTGNVSLTNIGISDPKVTVTGGPISLAPNAVDNTSFTAVYTLTQADIDKGGVYNLATANGTDPSNNPVNDESESGNPAGGTPGVPPVDPACPNCTITPLPSSPAMRLTKTGTYADSNSDGKVNVGDQINYTFKVENTGNVSLTNIGISDPKVTVTGGPISLAPNAVDNTSFTAVYTLTQVDIDKGGVYNLATASGTDPSGNPVTDESESGNPAGGTPGVPPVDPACPGCTITPLPSSPAMRLTKTGTYADNNSDGKVNVGDQINYTFKVENTGNVSLTNIGISDPKVTVTGGPISLAPNAVDNTSFTAVYTLTQADIDKGGVYNLATANGTDPSNNPVNDESESGNPAGGTPGVPPVDPACPNCTITPLPSSPAITLTKNTVIGTYSKVGDVINYILKVKNTGNVTLTNVNITDANADAGSILPGTISTLNVGAEVTVNAKHTLTLIDLNKGFAYNIANVQAKDPKGGDVKATSVDNNPAYPGAPVDPACPTCTITEIQQNASIALIKKVTNVGTGENGTFVLGDQIEYTFTITNTGNVTLSNLVLNDPLLSASVINIPGTLNPGASLVHIEKYTITATDVAKGNVTNQALISGADPKNKIVTDKSGTANTDDIATVTVIAKPPVASDDTAETKQNAEIKIPVLNNDVPGSSPVVPGSINIITPPKHGDVIVNADGTVTYKPNAGYTGPDDFTYTVKDKNGQVSNPAKATITVIPTEPIALDDATETQWNTEIKIPVYGNDKADGSPLDKTGVEITVQPKNGTLKMNPDGTVTYLPNSGYTGKDSFSYRIKDENGNWSNVAIVSITVKGFFIPNVITPNGDGKNDSFVIVGLENFSNVELTIFNRWGNEVYRNKNYRNTWTGDGLNEGTYYYLIRMSNNGKQEVYKGWVLIKR